MLRQCAAGFGSVALAAMLGEKSAKARILDTTHHAAKAKQVIFLYMDGGVSQVDSFDPKPRLAKDHGKPYTAKIEPTQFDNVGNILGSPWKASQHGESGAWCTDLFPHMAKHVDKMAIVRSMVSDFSEHNTANYFLHTGFGQAGRPSMGAWLSYGLGSECKNLPDFIVINGGLTPSGGNDNFAAGFLPAMHQATVFKPQPLPIANLAPPIERTQQETLAHRQLLRNLDELAAARFAHDDAIESAISNYELAYQMQQVAPELASLSGEPQYLLDEYGVTSDYEPTQIFARECLLARRMIEQGVRFVELTCPRISETDRWDAHSNLLKNHGNNARATDQPIAALLADLDQRGLLDETLVVWAGEFGRTPFSQGADGRDHNPFGFTVWLAGGGVKAGTVYGQTDEFGYRTVEGRVHIHDLHATMLHLMGIDHTKLTYRFGSRDMRLTDVFGEIVYPIVG